MPRPRSKLGQVRWGSGELQGLRRIHGESKEVLGEALGGEAWRMADRAVQTRTNNQTQEEGIEEQIQIHQQKTTLWKILEQVGWAEQKEVNQKEDKEEPESRNHDKR